MTFVRIFLLIITAMIAVAALLLRLALYLLSLGVRLIGGCASRIY